MTGEPVRIRLYLAQSDNAMIFLVRVALRFFMVVLSSTTIMLSGCLRINIMAAFVPRGVDSASTFITKTLSPSNGSMTKVFISSWNFLVDDGVQRTTMRLISSGRCVGISPLTQLSYTPFGATINAALILSVTYKLPIVSIATLDLPVPISINRA